MAGGTMKRMIWAWLGVSILLVLGWGSFGTCALAVDIGWMQKGVRLWYFGGTEGGGVGSSDAEEAYLIESFEGTNVQMTHHAAQNWWEKRQPIETGTYPLLDNGPCWIHPLKLKNLKINDYWRGQEIIYIKRSIFANDPPPYQLLPGNALYKLNPQREFVMISYILPDFSTGNAYFDAETGLLLYYHNLWGTSKMFLILSEINYDFGTKKAFPEDGGPHTGFHSWLNESSSIIFNPGGGMVDIHSQVESRYGNIIRTLVQTTLSKATLVYSIENYCFFGSIPLVRRIDFILQPPQAPPEQWSPYGKYLWWWVPPSTLGETSVNVLDVSMSRTSTSPYTFTTTENPSRFFFSTLWFGNDGYLIQFSAKDPLIGLDVNPGDNGFTKSKMVVYGLDYYQNTMGTATPSRPSAFNKVSPANVATIPPINSTLNWGNSPGVASYEYCYDKSNNTACDGNWTTTGANNSVILSGLEKGSTYYWQVRALNDFGSMDADGGNWWEFTISSNFYLYLPMILK
jgi:hypothetical protein